MMMNNLIKFLSIFFITCLILFSCSKDEPIIEEEEKEEIENTNTVDINGLTEKGPYLSGSTITINELNNNFAPTGRVFNTQIIKDDGSFELNGIELNSNYLSLSANGFYFNEVANDNSEAQLTMHAISDVSDASSININVITTLEKNRVEYLVANGSTFAQAKLKALNEVLDIFEISDNDFEAEDLTIGKAGDANAKLLAVSVILQGFLPIADLSELLSKISLDLREDGTLDDITLGEQLVYNANRISLTDIRNNLEERFQNIDNNDAVVPPFEDYVLAFIRDTRFEYKSSFDYPEEGDTGKNILFPGFNSTETGTHAMAAIIPEGGQLKVKITGNNWVYPAFQSNTGWDAGSLDRSDYSREFVTNRIGAVDFELKFTIHDPDGPVLNKVKVEVFENNDADATFSKEILLTDVELEIVYRDGLLECRGDYLDPGEHSMSAYMNEGLTLKAIVRGDYWDLDENQTNTGWKFTSLNLSDNSREFTSIDGYDTIDIKINLLTPPGDTLFDYTDILDSEGNVIGIDTTILDIDRRIPAAILEVYENGNSSPSKVEQLMIEN